MADTLYRIAATAEGWVASADGDVRVFVNRDEAVRWCQHMAVTSGTDAAPEEGAYGEADVEIDDG